MSKAREAVALAQQMPELKRKLKLLEKGMTSQEFLTYVEDTRPKLGEMKIG